MPEYITLKLGETKSGATKKLTALKATADFYGWTDEYEPWVAKTTIDAERRKFALDPGRRGFAHGSSGYHVRIARSPSKEGLKAGFTNRFKVSRNTGLKDLAELAHFTKVDWTWMESPTSGRLAKDRWLARYAAGL